MCGRKFALIFCAALLCSWPLLSAQEAPSPSTDTPPAASDNPSPPPSMMPPPPSASSETPGQVSNELNSYADRLDQMSTELKTLFREAGISLQASDVSLFSSGDSVTQSINSIKLCQQQIQDAQKQARLQRLNEDLWRSGTLVSGGAFVGCLIKPGLTPWGAAGGVVAAGIWELFELFAKPKIPLMNVPTVR